MRVFLAPLLLGSTSVLGSASETATTNDGESAYNEHDGGMACMFHEDCPEEIPFCYYDFDLGLGHCSPCSECHYCHDGSDGTCGDVCGAPTQEAGPCYGWMHLGVHCHVEDVNAVKKMTEDYPDHCKTTCHDDAECNGYEISGEDCTLIMGMVTPSEEPADDADCFLKTSVVKAWMEQMMEQNTGETARQLVNSAYGSDWFETYGRELYSSARPYQSFMLEASFVVVAAVILGLGIFRCRKTSVQEVDTDETPLIQAA